MNDRYYLSYFSIVFALVVVSCVKLTTEETRMLEVFNELSLISPALPPRESVSWNNYPIFPQISPDRIERIDIDSIHAIVSYVIYAPPNAGVAEKQCVMNTNLFMTRAVVPSDSVDYIFSIVGPTDAKLLQSLTLLSARLPNVRLRNVTTPTTIDLFVQSQVIKEYINDKRYFVLLNCGARGPYYSMNFNPLTRKLIPSLNWMLPFIAKMDGRLQAVGATISCEAELHIQSYAMVLERQVWFAR